MRALALAAALSLACRARHRSVDEAPRDAPGDTRAEDAHADAAVDAPEAAPRVTVAVASGEVRWDGTHRCSGAVPGGGLVRGARGLLCGDRVETAQGASARFELAGGNFCTLGGESAVEVAGHAGAALVLLRGVAELSSPFEAERSLSVDTPAGRVIVSVGTARVAVAADGAVRVAATEGAVTVWTAPPLSAPDAGVRAAVARSLDGASLAIALTGVPLAGAQARATPSRTEDAVRVWVRRRDAFTARPGGGRAAAEAFARAGAADERAVRDAIERLRGGAFGRDRDAAIGGLSLALGRLHARARRARELAGPGGTAPPALGSFEALRDEARAWASP